MSTPPVLASSTPGNKNAKSEVIRHLANFHPSIWGNQFIDYTPEVTSEHKQKQITDLKEDVRRELIVAGSEPSLVLLNLIDAVQRLSVAYHFETEIEEGLNLIYDNYKYFDDEDDNLYSVALMFRLLRQAGFNVSCDVFNKFKDDKGEFKACMVNDIHGMLALYEATHLMKHGEVIMEEAFNFTTAHLSSMVTRLSNPLASQVSYALKQPIHKGLPRLEARHYMSTYHQNDLQYYNELLLNFAKLDFNFLQSMHKEELSDISRWWKDLDIAGKLPFARDRVVESYFWILGVYYEPQYCLARKILTKVFSMTAFLDDIYDAYGTLEELELFTNAIERWDLSCVDQLPEYMTFFYEAFLDLYDHEIEEDMAKQGQSYRVHYAKETMKKLAQAYFVEAKWFQEGYVPTVQEYMCNALVSSGYYMAATTSFVGMGDIVTKDAFEWVFNDPKIVTASTTIARLMDDIASHKFEQKRGHVASCIECYMKQYGVPEQIAYDEFHKQVENAWKDINEECLGPTADHVPMPLLIRVLNLSRAAHVIYKSEDGYSHVGREMKERIASLLIDPVPI